MDKFTDSLAGDHLGNCADPSKVAPFILASQASLTVKGKNINQRFVE
jgi:hypothetical protein